MCTPAKRTLRAIAHGHPEWTHGTSARRTGSKPRVLRTERENRRYHAASTFNLDPDYHFEVGGSTVPENANPVPAAKLRCRKCFPVPSVSRLNRFKQLEINPIDIRCRAALQVISAFRWSRRRRGDLPTFDRQQTPPPAIPHSVAATERCGHSVCAAIKA